MKKLILMLVILSVSCAKNVNTGQNTVNNFKNETISIEFTSNEHFCELQQKLSAELELDRYDADMTIEGMSATQLNFEFDKVKLEKAGISFNEISSEFIAYVKKEYKGISAEAFEMSVLIEYSACTKLNYGSLRSYKYKETPIIALAELKVKYLKPADGSSAQLIKINIKFSTKNISKPALSKEISKRISEFEKNSGYQFNSIIK